MTESNPSAYSTTNSGRLATGDETENFLKGVWGHVGWGFEQHGLLADVLAHGKEVGNRCSLHSFLPKPFYKSVETHMDYSVFVKGNVIFWICIPLLLT